jgi:hypothetical protein
MRSELIWTFVVCAALILSFGVFVSACGDDDDDDDDDKENDFEELEGTAYDPDQYSDGYDSGDENAGQGCNCPGCEGCGDVVTMFNAFAVAEDFEAIFTDFGADELGYYLDLDSINIADDEAGCFVGMLGDSVDCVDQGLNCLMNGQDAACAASATVCIDDAQGEFFECLETTDGACSEYADCMMECSTGADQECYGSCMQDFDVCESVFEPVTRFLCLGDISLDFAYINDASDAFGLAADYAMCAR